MKRVRFISDAEAVLELGPETLFSKDDVQDMEDASADRWIRRGVAIEDPKAEMVTAAKKKAETAADDKKTTKGKAGKASKE